MKRRRGASEETTMNDSRDRAWYAGILDRILRRKQAEPRVKPKPRTPREVFVEYAKAIGSALVIALLLRQFVFQAFRIPTGSMLETLQIGDFLFVNKFLYGAKTPDRIRIGKTTLIDNLPVLKLPAIRPPEQGDIIVFEWPEDTTVDYIKRCVAVAGDRVQVDEGLVRVNGEVYESNYGDRDGDHSCVPSWADPDNCPPPRSKRDFAAYERGQFTKEFHLWNDLNRRAAGRDLPGFLMMTEAALAADVGLDAAALRPHVTALEGMGGRIRMDFDQHALAIIEAAKAANAPVVVPAGHIFMMGDNRYNSQDSRYWGPLDLELLKGKAMFIYWSWNGDRHLPRLNRIGDIIR